MAFVSRLFGWGAKGSLSSFGKQYKLMARTALTRDTFRLKFALGAPDAILGLPVGHHVEVRLPGSGGLSRAYTPVTGDETRGSFDLVVKVYPGGQLSEYLGSLRVGDEAEIAGPSGELTYKGGGAFEIADPFSDSRQGVQATSVALIAGGTGITPMYQIAQHSASLSNDNLEMSLLFGNRTPEDVFLRSELDSLAAKCSRFRVTYAVDEVPTGAVPWNGLTGRLGEPAISAALTQLPNRPELVCVCGPPGMHRAIRPLLEGLGFSKAEVFEF